MAKILLLKRIYSSYISGYWQREAMISSGEAGTYSGVFYFIIVFNFV